MKQNLKLKKEKKILHNDDSGIHHHPTFPLVHNKLDDHSIPRANGPQVNQVVRLSPTDPTQIYDPFTNLHCAQQKSL